MKKATALITIALMAGILLTGCGDEKKNNQTSSQTGNGTGTVVSTEKATEKVTEDENGYNMNLVGKFTGITEFGLTTLCINDDTTGTNHSIMTIKAGTVDFDGTDFYSENETVRDYAETVLKGNTVTLKTSNGATEKWTYDENNETISNGTYTFYEYDTAFIDKELSSGKSQQTISGKYYGTFTDYWPAMNGMLKSGDKSVVFEFNEDGTVTSTISNQYDFLNSSKYYVRDGIVYVYDDYDRVVRSGVYDSSMGIIILEGLELNK